MNDEPKRSARSRAVSAGDGELDGGTGDPAAGSDPLTDLYESAHAIGLQDTLDELLDELLVRARALIGFEHGALMLLDEEAGRLTIARLVGYGDRADEVHGISLAIGEGLSGWAVQHRESVRVGDVRSDPRYVEGLAEARSNLAVPLVVGSRVAGVINVESERPDAFTAEHEKLLTVLGAQAALAIIAYRTRSALGRRIEQLHSLYRISRLAAEGGNVGVTLNAMLDIAGEIIPEGQCAVLLLDEKKGVLRVRAGQGYSAEAQYLEIPVGEGVTGRCAATGETQIVDDIQELEEDRYIEGVPGARSEVAVPLVADGRLIGVLNAESVKSAAFDREQIQMLTVIARQAAQVIRSAQLLEQTRRLAVTDALTGLHNRRYFTEQLTAHVARAARYGEALALILLDVDHFKWVNDRFGHQVGDRCLQMIAAAIQSAVRESDLTARIGGEEFAVLVLRADRALAVGIATRIRDTVARLPVDDFGDAAIELTASLGVAFFPEDAITPKDLMALADYALYAAKQAGRDRVAVASGGDTYHTIFGREM